MVIVLEDHAAITPGGKPLAVLIPVANIVVCVIPDDSGVLIQSVGEDEAAVTVIFGVTVIVPVAFTAPQPPVKGIV